MDHTRHSGIFNVSRHIATIVGVGGIGSVTAMALGKMGFPIIDVYDFDVVEDVNLATQLFRFQDLGKPKVDAVAEMLSDFTDTDIMANWVKVNEETNVSGHFVISAVDGIDTRKALWSAVKDIDCVFIDARMSSEQFHMFTVEEDRDWYDTYLGNQNEEDVADEPCTSKATIYTAFIAAGFIGAQIRKVVTGIEHPKIFTFNIENNTFIQI